MKLESRLKALRREKGLTQAQAAEMCKVCQGSWNRWEHFSEFPGSYNMRQIAEAFDVSMDWLAGRTDKKEVNR